MEHYLHSIASDYGLLVEATILTERENMVWCARERKTSRVWSLLSNVSKLKVSNRSPKREVRETNRERRARGGGG